MKICIVTHTFPRFQGDTPAPFMENLARSLADLGHKVFVLTPYDPKFDMKAKRSYKLVTYRYALFDRFHVLGYSREFDYSKNLRLTTYLLAPFLLFFGFIALLRLVKQEKIEAISAHWIIPSGFIAALTSLVSKTPFTVTMPGSDIYLGTKNTIFRLMVAFASNNASYVLADNSHYMDQLVGLGINPNKRKIIVYGSDVKRFTIQQKDKTILKRLGLSIKTPVILAVGRLVPKKGFVYLVKAMPIVFKKFSNAKLVIVGDGIQRQVLEQEIERLGIKSKVILAGTINYDDLSKYYNLGSVFVMPSIRDEQGNIDASPVAMMEAMACGMPVVATKFSGSENFIVEGKSGYLVQEKDVKSISEAVMKLLSVDSITTKKNVRKIAVENFSTQVIAKKYTQIFKESIC